MEADDDITEDMSIELLETNKVKFDVKVWLSAIGARLADMHHVPVLPPSPSSIRIQENPLAQQNYHTEQSHQTTPVNQTAEIWSSKVWRQHQRMAGVLGLLWERHWQECDTGQSWQIFLSARPSHWASVVSDSRICPHFGKLQSSNRPTEETFFLFFWHYFNLFTIIFCITNNCYFNYEKKNTYRLN